jgi:hypothetical protein
MRNSKKETVKRILFKLYYFASIIYLPFLYFIEHEFGQLKYLSKHDYYVWKKAFLTLLQVNYKSNYGLGQYNLFSSFGKAKIKVVRMNNDENNRNNPIVILAVKNDKNRIKMLVEHYRKLGIKKFAFLDNGSTDGTYEWLCKQKDIDLFTSTDQYSSFTKEAWINRIVSYYGFCRWYILTDSDELVVYNDMEIHPLIDVVKFAENKGTERLKAITLDMYADTVLFKAFEDEKSIAEKYCWMDSDSYTARSRIVGDKNIMSIVGGPRFRVMGVTPTLMKYPLIYFSEGTVSSNAHLQFPYSGINNDDCYLGILHYKFLEDDKITYMKRVQANSGFSSGVSLKNGGYYRKYMDCIEKDSNITFMYSGSIKFDSSKALEKISLISKITFEDYVRIKGGV